MNIEKYDTKEIIKQINKLENKFSILNDNEFKNKTDYLKKQINKKKTNEILPETFAITKEVINRITGWYIDDIKLFKILEIYQKNDVVINTKADKIITVIFFAYLYALYGKGVHIIMSDTNIDELYNLYIKKVFSFLGMTTGLISNDLGIQEKKESYECDITCGTCNEFILDYLHDNTATEKKQIVQKGDLKYAIIFDIDMLNINPIIITKEISGNEYYYMKANAFVRRLKSGNNGEQKFDYIVDLDSNTVSLTNTGIKKAEENFELQDYYDNKNWKIVKFINNALIVNGLMEKDRDYIIRNGKLYLINKQNGKIIKKDEFNDGIWQAIEAKEHINISKEKKILATIKANDYFKLYYKVIGLKKLPIETGTNLELKTNTIELQNEIYKLRRKILMEKDIKKYMFEIIDMICKKITDAYYNNKDLNKIESILIKRFKMNNYANKDKIDFISRLLSLVKAQYEKNEQILGNKEMRKLEKEIMIREIDNKWIKYLEEMSVREDNMR